MTKDSICFQHRISNANAAKKKKKKQLHPFPFQFFPNAYLLIGSIEVLEY